MPVFEPADESGHYAHILYIWKQKRLPNLIEPLPLGKGIGYTAYSPLYYWSLIPLARLIDAPLESEELLPYHPQKELFKKGVYAVYLHTRDELTFNWNRLMWSVHLLRMQNSVYGLLTVYLVYLAGKKLFGGKSLKPLAAAALVGFDPMFAHISSSIVNVNLVILVFSLFFYLAVESLRNFQPMRLPRPAAVGLAMTKKVKLSRLNFIFGVLAGLAYLTKITGVVLIPIWLMMTLIAARILLKSLSDRVLFLVKSLGLFLIGFLITVGWYLARNYMLYGSLLETGAAIRHFGRPAMQLEMSGPINYWIGFIQTNFKTFFSGYGMVTVNLPDGILFLLLIILLIGFWGILIRIGKIWQVVLYRFRIKSVMTMKLFLIASAILIILSHVAVNFSVEAFHARDLFIGMVPFSLLLVDGWAVWINQIRAGKLWSSWIINFLMFSIILTVSLFHFTQPVLVDFVKIVLSGSQILSPTTVQLAVFTAIFYILWMIFRLFSLKMAKILAWISSNKNFPWVLVGGLFASNILILFLLVISKLYQL